MKWVITVKETFGSNLRSIYVRGSVSVGRAKPYISDIDSVAITQNEVSSGISKNVFRFSVELQKKFQFVTLVDMTSLSSFSVLGFFSLYSFQT